MEAPRIQKANTEYIGVRKQVVQAFNWLQMGEEGHELCSHSKECHTPNRTELRSMAWQVCSRPDIHKRILCIALSVCHTCVYTQAIAGGANGVFFFNYDDMFRNPDVGFEIGWASLKAVAAQIARFAPALLSVSAPSACCSSRAA